MGVKNILIKKKEGIIAEFSIGLILIVGAILFVFTFYKLEDINKTKRLAQDGLDFACLSSAIIDLNEYGTTNVIVNNNVLNSYNKFVKSIKLNFNLDDNMESKSENIKGKVKIEKFILYNIKGNDVEVNEIDGVGNVTKNIIINGKGSTTSPTGEKIESTTIYGNISFKIKGFGNVIEYPVNAKATVDIVDDNF